MDEITETAEKGLDDNVAEEDSRNQKNKRKPSSKDLAEFRAVAMAEDDDDEEFFSVKKKPKASKSKSISDPDEEEFWKSDGVDPNERFLREYFFNRTWMASGNGEEMETIGEHDEEDDEDLDKQDRFEKEFNFRYQDKDSHVVQGHPRKTEESARRKVTKRAEKRQEAKLAKQEKLMKKEQELSRIRNDKKKEILGKLQEIQKITGNKLDLDLDLDDLDEGQMSELLSNYNDNDNEDDDVKPQWNDDIDDSDIPEDLKREVEKKMKEYQNLNFADLIAGDTPIRFNYIKVRPGTYGMSIEEILTTDEKELNNLLPLASIAPYVPETNKIASGLKYKVLQKKKAKREYEKQLLQKEKEMQSKGKPQSQQPKEKSKSSLLPNKEKSKSSPSPNKERSKSSPNKEKSKSPQQPPNKAQQTKKKGDEGKQ
eukprot:TRINITY_DN7837_c0_g1_i1.p1 TRINITY_DN7837_c0_g1~~TRINITY_DN7837_c0_g1_i1.p1  ORF type:complete len:499 (+),score=145.01 TRINITY_DN7837_c0_g1_i1:222-1499(+)